MLRDSATCATSELMAKLRYLNLCEAAHIYCYQ